MWKHVWERKTLWPSCFQSGYALHRQVLFSHTLHEIYDSFRNIYPSKYNKHKTLTQCWFNVGPAWKRSPNIALRLAPDSHWPLHAWRHELMQVVHAVLATSYIVNNWYSLYVELDRPLLKIWNSDKTLNKQLSINVYSRFFLWEVP